MQQRSKAESWGERGEIIPPNTLYWVDKRHSDD